MSEPLIIVTGGAGFIGSNLVRHLNERGHRHILVVDDLTDGHKFANLAGLHISDYLDKDEFLARLQCNADFGRIQAVFHQGACSTTTEWNGRYMMEVNFEYSKQLLLWCQQHALPLVYASSAAVYGGSEQFIEQFEHEKPLNVYGYSKYLFDQYVRRVLPHARAAIVGLRYFNVYGPNEQHKAGMASVAYHLNKQLKTGDVCKLFEGSHGYSDGGQTRDFIHVDDVCKVNLFFFDNPARHGIFNCGTGRAQPFNDVAKAVLAWHGRGKLEYIPFPPGLKDAYQAHTEANTKALRAAGYTQPFLDVASGVKQYLDVMNR